MSFSILAAAAAVAITARSLDLAQAAYSLIRWDDTGFPDLGPQHSEPAVPVELQDHELADADAAGRANAKSTF